MAIYLDNVPGINPEISQQPLLLPLCLKHSRLSVQHRIEERVRSMAFLKNHFRVTNKYVHHSYFRQRWHLSWTTSSCAK